MPSEDIKQGISDVLDGLFSSIEQGNAEAYRAVAENPVMQRAVTAIKEGEQDDFYFGLIYPISNMVDGLLNEHLPSTDARFLMKHGQFIERHYKTLFQKLEGSACCADKSSTIMRCLFRFFTTGKEIAFNYEQDYTYHLPKKIFRTHAEIIEFFHGLHSLYYGNPDRYLVAIQKIIATAKTSEESNGSGS